MLGASGTRHSSVSTLRLFAFETSAADSVIGVFKSITLLCNLSTFYDRSGSNQSNKD